MSDGTTVLDPVKTKGAIGTDVIATDDITQSGSVAEGQKVQRVKSGFGPDGEYADVTEENPLPIETSYPLLALAEAIDTKLAIIIHHLSLLTREEVTEDDIEDI